jgi:hypothetical protein
LLSWIAFQISVPWAPEIELILITLFTCGIMLAISLSPTYLPFPFLCAVSTLLVPSAPEVFAVSAYASWWAGLLLLLVPLWRSERQEIRWLYILFGGLSSPIIIAIAFIELIRAVLDRNRAEFIATALCVLTASVQTFTLWKMAGMAGAPPFEPQTIGPNIVRFVGSFFVGNQAGQHYYLLTGALAVVALSAIAWTIRNYLDRYFVILVAMFAIACAMSLARLPITGIHPFLGGPRYFFYPFVLLTWIGIWIAAKSSERVRAGFAVVYVATILFAAPSMSWRHDPIDWRAHLVACAATGAEELPILSWSGHPREISWIKFSRKECKNFIDQSLFPVTWRHGPAR